MAKLRRLRLKDFKAVVDAQKKYVDDLEDEQTGFQTPVGVNYNTAQAAVKELLEGDVPEAQLPAALNPDPPQVKEDVSQAALAVIAELARRKVEALRLYEPLELQERFHASRAPERLLRGSNRAGKTLAAAVEVARAATGQDPHKKYPEKDGRIIAVGKSGKAIGEVMWRKLSRAGAFRIIRDEKTGLFRAFRPWDKRDQERKHLSKPAPPLIPPRMIRSISWESKAEGIPSLVKLRNGWEIAFYSSLGLPPQGVDVDLVWFDEEIVVEEWYSEMSARLVDRSGRFFWSATPQSGTEQLYVLHERAEEQRLGHFPNPSVEEFVTLLDDNPHFDEYQKAVFEAKLTETEKSYRIRGEFLIATYKVYGEFDPKLHCRPPFPVPTDWTHYAAVDPGRTVCAVLFAAVPPPHHPMGGRVVFYDELYIRQCTAHKFGEAFASRVRGRNFEAFVIDGRGGRIREIGTGKGVEQQYAAELKARNVASAQTGTGFMHGNDDPAAGIMAVKSWLESNGGEPRLVCFDTLKEFLHEIKFYHNRKKNGELTDSPEQRKNHLMDCLRYLCMHGTPYREPKGFKRKGSPAYRAFQAKKKRLEGGKGKSVVFGPGK